ncbi:MAG TPA: hypothetical protein VEB40_06355 [Flavipsychrobacter sp.]|nr:hypothetical protein [Flavipsychrobacter sp.]
MRYFISLISVLIIPLHTFSQNKHVNKKGKTYSTDIPYAKSVFISDNQTIVNKFNNTYVDTTANVNNFPIVDVEYYPSHPNPTFRLDSSRNLILSTRVSVYNNAIARELQNYFIILKKSGQKLSFVEELEGSTINETYLLYKDKSIDFWAVFDDNIHRQDTLLFFFRLNYSNYSKKDKDVLRKVYVIPPHPKIGVQLTEPTRIDYDKVKKLLVGLKKW